MKRPEKLWYSLLTITRKLIELQGSAITVKSEIGKGSEFSFLIHYKKR
jgi:signal transduction histidine kinase